MASAKAPFPIRRRRCLCGRIHHDVGPALRLRRRPHRLLPHRLARDQVGKALKHKLEEGHQDAGYRSAAQVLCNSASAAAAALLWSALYAPGSWVAAVADAAGVRVPGELRVPHDFDAWCPLTPPPQAAWSRTLLFATLGHFACCLGDTLASELGILSKTPPILVTTLKPVPPGTNGGMSTVGTLSSLAGGTLMGLTVAGMLLWQSPACQSQWTDVVASLLLWGTFAGGFGSLLDSLLGATVQCTRFLNTTNRIVTDESGAPAPGSDVKIISGYDLLTNNQVNLLSSIVTAALLGAFA
ncbi:integral membrane protein DUF92-domain-containing protein [Epithele typhae]|uniref:integral membrane protein DUF92-domain-containing protein n=1 Tax=Epithele typhae TaxID=378194 RepID=UPI0020089934|nr:integral membrane protein DUF92-domain-containing protein [Epithele typhae]KAH9923708.1 integral membrane protein DUF92-domain-containing protein [Epithele typhae]